MNQKEITIELEKMIGKTYSYANKIHYVKEVKVDQANDKFWIISNLANYERRLESFTEFIDYWTPITTSLPTEPNVPHTEEVSISLDQENNLSQSLIAILNENITKVQQSEKYIPQAQCINNNINTIVNIEKMRLAYIKQFKTRPTKLGA